MKKLHKLVFVHYNIRLRVRNLTCQSDTDDYYNPIDLNNIFNDDIFDEWIREGEQLMLPPHDLNWLDESIHRSNENGGDGGNDEETHGVDGNQRDGAMTWDSEYYATQDTKKFLKRQ